MPETTTPGQIAYEAYFMALAGGICHCLALTWGQTPLAQQRAWDAAAQAVLAQEGRRQRHQEDAMTLIAEGKPFFEDAFAGVLECIDVQPLGRGIRVVARVTSDDLRLLNRCLRVFDETWWLANCHRSDGLLVFDYETLLGGPTHA